MNLSPFQYLVLYFSFVCVYSTEIVIKSGVVKSQGQAQNENIHDVKFHKGIANFEGEEGFNKDDEKKSVVAQDSGRYGEQEANKKSHLNADNFQNQNFHQTGGGLAGNSNNKVAHHKGHHKSGFANSYHKDESGSNSSYFDDGSDEADAIQEKNYRESFGDAAQKSQGGSKYDRSNLENDQARHGLYDNAGKYEKDYGNKRQYNRNNYYDNREDLGRKNLRSSYEGGERYGEEHFEKRPPHYPPPSAYHRNYRYREPLPLPPPIPPKHRITIYEDPRYVHGDYRYRRSDDYYADDYVELDVRSPSEREPLVRYYEEKPDYYY